MNEHLMVVLVMDHQVSELQDIKLSKKIGKCK
jgi:hypothetical protein